jgi:hypothetical protein
MEKTLVKQITLGLVLGSSLLFPHKVFATLPTEPTYDYVIIASGEGAGVTKDMFKLMYAQPYQKDEQDFSNGFPVKIRDGISGSMNYWADVLAQGSKNTQPVYIKATTNIADINQNAQGGEKYWDKENTKAEDYWGKGMTETIIQKNYPLGQQVNDNLYAGTYDLGYIGTPTSSDNLSAWYINTKTQVPDSNAYAQGDLAGCSRHELGHALGIGSMASRKGFVFNTVLSSFDKQLVDANGNRAKEEMKIVKTNANIPKGAKVSDYFVLGTDSINTNGYVYFTGKNVEEVRQGALINGLPGIPVNGLENGGSSSEGLDLSHFQALGNLMSHEKYCNYTTLIEIELAAMQDMGYVIDRRNFFGYSIYNDGMAIVNTNPYYARNSDGTGFVEGKFNQTALGVGLHLYGSNNTVTQAADILTMGTAAIGIRVDGCENNLTVAKSNQVSADGEKGTGIWVAYGNSHEVTINGSVTAKGEGGIGARFDFGSSSNGSGDEYRGSYIRWNEQNADWVQEPGFPDAEVDGPQVKNFNIKGTLEGKDKAIYIGANTLVANINVKDGAVIKGDIQSDWMSQDMIDAWKKALTENIRLDDFRLTFNGDTETLATNLNFQGKGLEYAGDIMGSNNMRLNVVQGELAYTGTASVINATVNQDATMEVNGSIILNKNAKTMDLYDKETKTQKAGVAFKQAGQFINNGIIAPLATSEPANDTFTITGDLINNGFLGVTNDINGTRLINVLGAVALGEKAAAAAVEGNSYLPGSTYKILTANSITGTFGDNAEFSGMLAADGEVINGGKAIEVTVQKANNLGTTTANQAETYIAMDKIYDKLPDDEKNTMGVLYSLGAESAKDAFDNIKGSDLTAVSYNAAREDWVAQVVNKGLTNRPETLEIQPSYRMWADYGHAWDSQQSMNGKQNFMVLGADKAYKKNRRLGFYAGYRKGSYTGSDKWLDTNDIRVGLYHWQKNGQWDYLTQLNYGHQNNDFSRGIPELGLKSEGSFHGNAVFLGIKARKNQYKDNSWNINPYFTGDVTIYRQNGYEESGAYPFGHDVDGMSATYTTVGTGLEFQRNFTKSVLSGRVGYRRVLSGNDPDISYSYRGDNSRSYREYNEEIGKDYLLTGVSYACNLSPSSTLKVNADWKHAKGHTSKLLGLNYMYKF